MTVSTAPVEIALWSGDYGLPTGQAAVTAHVITGGSGMAWREHVYRGAGWRSISSWLCASFGLWRDIARGRVKTLYLVCSRSDAGFVRDIPALLAARVGVRTIVHAHGSDIVDLLARRRVSPLARALYARCEIVVPSQHLLEPLESITGRSPRLCENYQQVSRTLKNVSSDSNELVVCWNSNVLASKGFFDLAKGIALARDAGLPVRLVSMGQPMADAEMSREEVCRRIEALRSQDWFDHRGPLDPAACSAVISAADVVALPSRYASECQPLAVIQAMCAGKAILAADTPALRATLCGYPAHFVPVGSSEAIATVLRALLDRKLKNPLAFPVEREAAAETARKRFSVERFDREMRSILLSGAS